MGPCSAKGSNARKIDELPTEDNNGDIVRVMGKQMGEMSANMRKQMNEMTRMMAFSINVLRIQNKEHADRFRG